MFLQGFSSRLRLEGQASLGKALEDASHPALKTSEKPSHNIRV
jgi:hypothetical protein